MVLLASRKAELLAAAGLAALAAVWWFSRSRRRGYAKLSARAVTVLTSMEHTEEVLREWLHEMRSGRTAAVVGLDTEWVGKRPVALLQLADDQRCFLVRLCMMRDAPPSPSLVELLADASVLKTGVGVQQDLQLLGRALPGCTPRGAVDARTLANTVGGIQAGGLHALAWDVLGEALDKSPTLRCSDWEAARLTAAQVEYAAKDAHISHTLVIALHKRHAASCAEPEPLWDWAAKYVGRPPKAKKLKGLPTPKAASDSAPMHAQAQAQQDSCVPKGSRPSNRLKSRAGPLYDGWLMRSPAGVSMCRLSRQRAEWYVKRGLAHFAEDGAHAITLTFEPNGLGNSSEPWLLAPKENICVGCGIEQEAAVDGLMRWSVVPPSFRSLLPETHKSRDSHDIVLLCRRCHEALVRPYAAHRAKLFVAHCIDVDTARTEDDPALIKVRPRCVLTSAVVVLLLTSGALHSAYRCPHGPPSLTLESATCRLGALRAWHASTSFLSALVSPRCDRRGAPSPARRRICYLSHGACSWWHSCASTLALRRSLTN